MSQNDFRGNFFRGIYDYSKRNFYTTFTPSHNDPYIHRPYYDEYFWEVIPGVNTIDDTPRLAQVRHLTNSMRQERSKYTI